MRIVNIVVSDDNGFILATCDLEVPEGHQTVAVRTLAPGTTDPNAEELNIGAAE